MDSHTKRDTIKKMDRESHKKGFELVGCIGREGPVSFLSKAITLAVEAHDGQLDRGDKPYILHPLAVMQSVVYDDDAMIVAVLHDVIEDTDVTSDDLFAMFSAHIVEAVVLLSREPAGTLNRPTYREYIERLAPNDLARKVKLADLRHNMSPDRVADLSDEDRGIVKRYTKAVKILENYEASINKLKE